MTNRGVSKVPTATARRAVETDSEGRAKVTVVVHTTANKNFRTICLFFLEM